jgi:hypothetical protein
MRKIAQNQGIAAEKLIRKSNLNQQQKQQQTLQKGCRPAKIKQQQNYLNKQSRFIELSGIRHSKS